MSPISRPLADFSRDLAALSALWAAYLSAMATMSPLKQNALPQSLDCVGAVFWIQLDPNRLAFLS
jgi:hypothetical protein